jgi:hypothetical protein
LIPTGTYFAVTLPCAPGISSPFLKQQGLCLTCSNRIAALSSGTRIAYNLATGAPVPTVATSAEVFKACPVKFTLL